MAEVKINVTTTERGSQQINNLEQKFKSLADTAKNLTAGLAAAGATFKKAFDLSREGAALLQIRESFDRMNESVFKSPKLLEEMRAAARGTIGDIDLMRGLLTLTAGVTDEMARTMADAAPKLLEIAKAANKLNPSLGDTAFLYQSLTLGIKRNSPMIIDNTGLQLRLGEANEALAAKLGKTVEQLTAQERTTALLNATMEAGDRLIGQVGGNVDSMTDAWDRVTVEAESATEAVKRWLAQGLMPWIQIINGDFKAATSAMGDRLRDSIRNQEQAAQKGKELTAVFLEQATVLGGITGARNMAGDELMKLAAQFVDLGSTNKEAAAALSEFFGQTVKIRGGIISINGVVVEKIDNLRAMRDQYQATSFDQKFFIQTTNETTEALKLATKATAEQVRQNEELKDKIAIRAAVEENAGMVAVHAATAANLALKELVESEEEARAAAEAWQSRMDSINSSTLATQFALIGDLIDAQGAFSEAYGKNAQDAKAAKEEIDRINGEIAESYRRMVFEMVLADAGGVFTAEVAKFAVALGVMGEAEAEMRLKVQETDTQIKLLTEAMLKKVEATSDGKVTMEEYTTALGLLEDGTATTWERALLLADAQVVLAGKFGEAKGQAELLRQELEAIPDNIPVHISVTSDPVPALPSGPTSGGQTGQAFSHGGFVGGGIPGRDSVPAMLMPGEFVIPASAAQQIGAGNLESLRRGDMSGGGGVNFSAGSIVVHAGPGMDERRLAQAVSIEIARMTRRANASGAGVMGI